MGNWPPPPSSNFPKNPRKNERVFAIYNMYGPSFCNVLILNLPVSLYLIFERFDIFRDFQSHREFDASRLFDILRKFPLSGDISQMIFLGMRKDDGDLYNIVRLFDILDSTHWKIPVFIFSNMSQLEINRIIPISLIDNYCLLSEDNVKVRPESVREIIDTNLGQFGKKLETHKKILLPEDSHIQLLSGEVNKEFFEYLKKHPELLYKVSPRKFEKIISNILEDMGCDIHLTPETHDGGRDILASFQTPFGEVLTIVECKRFKPENKIGIDLVERFLWVLDRKDNASFGIFATTSYFTKKVQNMEKIYRYRLKLVDFEILKGWISNYGSWKGNPDSKLWLPYFYDDD